MNQSRQSQELTIPKTKSKTQTWEEISKQLVGKDVEVRWTEEANESYWDYQPVLLILDDGTALCLCLTMKMQGIMSSWRARDYTSNEV